MITDLDTLIVRLAEATREYGRLAQEAAVADSTYKRERAKRFLLARDEARTVDERHAICDADDTVADLAMTRAITAALAESQKERIRSIRENIGAVRTQMADARFMDDEHAKGHHP